MSKPKLAYLFAVDQAIQDRESNKYSYIGQFQTININRETGFYYADFSIVGRVYDISQGEITARIEILGPDGSIFSKVDLSGTAESNQTHLQGVFNSLKFSEEGDYIFRFVYKDEVYTVPGNTIKVSMQ